MSNSVLFDAPGPRTVARHRIYTVVASFALLAAVVYAVKRLYDAGQFEYALWEPFVTPNIMRAIGEAWLDTLSMAALAVLGALVFGIVFFPNADTPLDAIIAAFLTYAVGFVARPLGASERVRGNEPMIVSWLAEGVRAG